MTYFVGDFLVAVCSIFTGKRWFTVRCIQFLLVRPERAVSVLHQCCSFLAPLPGDANWAPLTLWGEWHLTRGCSLFTHRDPWQHSCPLHTPAAPSWALLELLPRRGLLHMCQGREHPSADRPGTQAHTSMCRLSWLCIVCTGASCYGP